MTEKEIILLEKLSVYLTEYDCFVTAEMLQETMADCRLDAQRAYQILIAGALDIFEDAEYMRFYLPDMVKRLDPEDYRNDDYLKTVVFPEITSGQWQMTKETCRPCQAFVWNDLLTTDKGRIIPRIGFFEESYAYPCIRQNGREWMTVTPNEIETMKKPVEEACGNVLTYGLGLGYFVFHAAAKAEVDSVTVVEKDPQVIRLFEKYLLPQFKNREKISIICDDAFDYARTAQGFDYVFADIWHDPSDGMDLWNRLKTMEKPGIRYGYWISETMKCYLEDTDG